MRQICKNENIEAVNLVLEEIKADKVPALLVYNKIDLLKNVAPHIEYDDENKLRCRLPFRTFR